MSRTGRGAGFWPVWSSCKAAPGWCRRCCCCCCCHRRRRQQTYCWWLRWPEQKTCRRNEKGAPKPKGIAAVERCCQVRWWRRKVVRGDVEKKTVTCLGCVEKGVYGGRSTEGLIESFFSVGAAQRGGHRCLPTSMARTARVCCHGTFKGEAMPLWSSGDSPIRGI